MIIYTFCLSNDSSYEIHQICYTFNIMATMNNIKTNSFMITLSVFTLCSSLFITLEQNYVLLQSKSMFNQFNDAIVKLSR